MEWIPAKWPAKQLRQFLWIAIDRYSAEVFALIDEKPAVGDPAEPVGLLQHCIKYRGEVAGRGIDDLQHLCGRGLLSEGLVELARLLIQLPLRFVPLSSALVKLASKVSNDLLWIG
jgi:hypothetical protein